MIPLHVRSHYSLLRGGSSIASLIARAKDLGLPALALTDTDGAYGAAIFYRAAKEAGIAPIIGADVDGMVLLTRSRAGWSNLCSIISRKQLGRPLEIERFQGDLHVLVEDLATARALRGKVDRLWVELVRPGRSATHERDLLVSGFPLVASTDVHMATPADFTTHRVLSAIRLNTMLSELGPTCDPGNHLRDLRPLFADVPEALANAETIAADCTWDFLPAPVIFPSYDAPPGHLRALCEQGLLSRYGAASPEARERLERELGVIDKLGFNEYFLVVNDIVRFARSKGAPLAGRGSGASSLVAYVLGLTNVCPLTYGLQFERFLHEGRADWPDLDLDFCWRTRDSIIDYAFERFGRDRVAMVSSHLTFQDRGAFREAAKVHGLSEDQIRLGSTIDPARLAAILADARRIHGAPQHLSVHPGGIVIARGPIDRVTPVQRADKGVIISQFDKDGVEEIGLVKIDLLGNRAVSTIRATTDQVEKLDGYRIDVESIADEDPATVALLTSGRTIGVNQVESPAMRHLLRMMRPRGVSDLMKALALIRPGAASGGMMETFVRRHRGFDAWSVHPKLKRVLDATCGVMLYEDDAMLILSALTGMPLAEGDRFRRRVQKARTPEDRFQAGREFGRLALAAGTPVEIARDLWRQMAKFTGYTFCMSHAASYARLAWAGAWLKAHHPVAFWVAALNNNMGMYEKRVYVEEARRGGIPTRLPCLNASEREFSAERGTMRAGLELVAGLSAKTIDAILADRPFESLQDLLRRADPARPEAESLIRCGALDGFGRSRPELLLELAATLKLIHRKGRVAALEIPRVRDLDELEKRRWELAILGICPGERLMSVLAPGFSPTGITPSTELSQRVGQRVRMAGVLDALRVNETNRGDQMEFLTLEDDHGVFEVTVWPSVYRRIAGRIRGLGPYLVTGTVEDRYGAMAVKAEDVTRIPNTEYRMPNSIPTPALPGGGRGTYSHPHESTDRTSLV